MSLQITGKYLNYNHNFEVRYRSVSYVTFGALSYVSHRNKRPCTKGQSTVDVRKVPGGKNQVEHK